MFEKKERKQEKIIDSELEEIIDYSKRKYASKIYIPEFDSIYNINSLGVVTLDNENNDLFCVIDENELFQKFKSKKIKLYKNKKNENLQKESKEIKI